jgi:hypothetical protein
MVSRRLSLWRTPHRLTAFQAKIVAGLAIVNLMIAASGLFVYDGVPRIVHVSALALVGLTNLSWATGSLIPEERGGKTLRDAMVPLSLLMLVALAVSVSMLWSGLGPDTVLTGFFAAFGAVMAVQLTRER